MTTTAEERRGCDICGGLAAAPVLEKSGAAYLLCPCGFIYSSSLFDAARQANDDYFGGALDRYAERHFSPAKQKRYDQHLRYFERWRGGGRLLEVGSNVGGFLYAATRAGWTPTGVEPVAECAAFGRERYGLDVRSAFMEDAGLADESFDFVFSNAVFEHLPSPTSVLREIHRVLKPGGVVYIDTVNWDSYTRRRLGGRWKLIDPVAHVSLFTPATMVTMAESCGLEVLQVRTHGFRRRPNDAPRLGGLKRWAEELAKLPMSVAARVFKKGDSIDMAARRVR